MKKETHRSQEHHRETRDGPTQVQPMDFCKHPKQLNRERIAFPTNGVGATGQLKAKKKKNLGLNLTSYTKLT